MSGRTDDASDIGNAFADEGYTDVDWAHNRVNRGSVGAYIFKLDGPVSWQSKKQSIITTSALVSEYAAFLEAVKEALWLCQLLADLNWNPPIYLPKRAQSKVTWIHFSRTELDIR